MSALLFGIATVWAAADGDGDGYDAGVDCDDADPAVHPGMREVLDDAGHYVAEGDTTAFVQAALRLLDDPQAYAEAVRRAQQRAAQITWQERARALVRFARACG